LAVRAYPVGAHGVTDAPADGSTAWVPGPEALAADLTAMLRTGVTVERCRTARALLALEFVAAKATTAATDDLAVSASNLIREACAAVDGMDTGATSLLLGLAAGSRRRPLTNRRADAAANLGYSTEHLRKDREPLLVRAVADELYAMDSAYRLRHRHRMRAEREPHASRLGIDWLMQHRSYRRVWTPVMALRNDLLVLLEYFGNAHRDGRTPHEVDYDARADISDRLSNMTWRLAQFSIAIDDFVEREGGLWILADASSEIQAADAMYRLQHHLPFGEADVSWARLLLKRSEQHELDAYVDELVAAGDQRREFMAVWVDWAWAAVVADDPVRREDATSPPNEGAPGPRTECGRWLASAAEFIGLIDDDWYRVADWYRSPHMEEGIVVSPGDGA
jgi:hypothetical protein